MLPIIRGAAPANRSEEYALTAGEWIWGDSAANGQTPPSDETIVLRHEFKLTESVIQGGAVITCDNGFILL